MSLRNFSRDLSCKIWWNVFYPNGLINILGLSYRKMLILFMDDCQDKDFIEPYEILTDCQLLNRSFDWSRWILRFVMWVFIVFPGQCAEAPTSAVSTIAIAIPSLFFIMTLVALISNMRWWQQRYQINKNMLGRSQSTFQSSPSTWWLNSEGYF